MYLSCADPISKEIDSIRDVEVVHCTRTEAYHYVASKFITSDKGGGKCVCPRLSVCLSVSKITQKRLHVFG